jgi:hypothetical protein
METIQPPVLKEHHPRGVFRCCPQRVGKPITHHMEVIFYYICKVWRKTRRALFYGYN